jgi:hypothetical protein
MGQHLTKPHSGDEIEKSHHTESSEGHQVPGPPHSHDHDEAHGHHHGHDHGGGKVVAVIAFGALLALPLWVGLRAPQATRHQAHAPQPAAAPQGEARGTVVRDDGQRTKGIIRESDDVVTVQTDAGEVMIPRSRVRAIERGDAPRGGGIVVLKDGQVLVGRVVEGDRAVTVGDIVIPWERVRWSDPNNATLTDDYWRKHGDMEVEPIHDPRYAPQMQPPPSRQQQQQQQPRANEHEGASLPARRARAQVAQTSARWEEAVTTWAAVYRESRLPVDLENLLRCTQSLIVDSFTRTPPRPATLAIKEALGPLQDVRAVREKLAYAYHETALHYLVIKDLPEARRWTSELAALGRDHQDRVQALTRAAEQVQAGIEEEEEEEAEEHEHDHEEGHRPG